MADKKPSKAADKTDSKKKSNGVVASVKDSAVKAKNKIVPSKKADAAKRKPLSLIIAIALTVIVVLLATFGVLIYKFKQDSPR